MMKLVYKLLIVMKWITMKVVIMLMKERKSRTMKAQMKERKTRKEVTMLKMEPQKEKDDDDYLKIKYVLRNI